MDRARSSNAVIGTPEDTIRRRANRTSRKSANCSSVSGITLAEAWTVGPREFCSEMRFSALTLRKSQLLCNAATVWQEPCRSVSHRSGRAWSCGQLRLQLKGKIGRPSIKHPLIRRACTLASSNQIVPPIYMNR
jgi:hypothetical protein